MPSGRSASSCDAERRELHSHAGACGTITRLPYGALRRHAFQACGTIIATIVRRSASHAFRTLCVLLRRGASRTAFPRWSVGNDHLNCRTALCVDISIRTCGTIIAIIVRRSASHAFPDALRPLATRSVENCIPRWSVGNDHLNCRTALCVDISIRTCGTIIAIIVRRSASRTALPRWSVRNDNSTNVRRSASTLYALRQPSTLGVIELPWPRSRARFCCRHRLPPASRRADH